MITRIMKNKRLLLIPCFLLIYHLSACNIFSSWGPVPHNSDTPDINSQYPYNSSEVTDTLTPLVTPSPTINKIATNSETATQISDGLRPTLLIELGSKDYTLSKCNHKGLQGEFWLSQYPYQSAFPFLADPQYGFFDPVWANNGKEIAFFSLDWDILPTIIANDNGQIQRYDNSIQVWVSYPDGSGKKAVSKSYPRVEFVDFENQCIVITFIGTLNWSFDDQMLAYILSPDDKNANDELVITNVNTGEELTLPAVELWDLEWANNKNQLALLDNGDKSIKLVSVDEADSPLLLAYPNDLPTDLIFHHILWQRDDQNLIVIGSIGFSTAIWDIDLKTGEWTPRLMNGPDISPNLFQQQIGFTCSQIAEPVLEFIDVNTGSTIAKESMPDDISCYPSNWYQDDQGRPTISFLSKDGKHAWSVKLGSSSTYTEVLEFPADIFQDDKEILGLDWSH